MSTRPSRRRSRGQSLVEFAFVLPVFLALLGGTIQFGLIFWAQNTLTQIVRDTGRWASTQQDTCYPDTSADGARNKVGAQANAIAYDSSLLGYRKDMWPVSPYQETVSLTEGIQVSYFEDSSGTVAGCPPKNNSSSYHVTIRIFHTVPTFFPGLQYLPALGTCDAKGNCSIVLRSSGQFRMEPRQ